ncbi:MAG TPA: hypothetical protein VFP12_11810 [Allosphingosinicella sp.]|nr:hypothetical protein [Allosphingosinicella sp.]
MRESDYRAWLEAGPLDPKTIEDQLSRARRVQRAFGDLNTAYRQGQSQRILDRLEYTAEDGRRGRPIPDELYIVGDPVTGMANLRTAARKYFKFEAETASSQVTLGDVVQSPELLMGVKAVFGPLSSHVLCFGGRGPPNSAGYYGVARGVAERAATRPFILAIAGGSHVRDNLNGRVLNLARSSGSYGLTSTFLEDPEEVKRLQQWPVAVALHDVWQLDGFPHLVTDLGMGDRTVLAAAMDGVVRPALKIDQLWSALRKWPVRPTALRLPVNFYDRPTSTLITPRSRKLPEGFSSEEGARRWTSQLAVERDSRLSREAKRLNAEKYGKPTCEACRFSHADLGMFDAHHPTPLAVGARTTLAEHLIVLCPTCHRRAHRADRLQPQSLSELQQWIVAGRP